MGATCAAAAAECGLEENSSTQCLVKQCKMLEDPPAPDQLCIVRLSVQRVVLQRQHNQGVIQRLLAAGGARVLHVEVAPMAPASQHANRRTGPAVLVSGHADEDEVWMWGWDRCSRSRGWKAAEVEVPPMAFSIPCATELAVRVVETTASDANSPMGWISAAAPPEVRGEAHFLPVVGTEGQLSIPLVRDGRACGTMQVSVTVRKTQPNEQSMHSRAMTEEVDIGSIHAPSLSQRAMIRHPSLGGRSHASDEGSCTSVLSETHEGEIPAGQADKLDEFIATAEKELSLKPLRNVLYEGGARREEGWFEKDGGGLAAEEGIERTPDATKIWQRARKEAIIIEEVVARRMGLNIDYSIATSAQELDASNFTPISTPTKGSPFAWDSRMHDSRSFCASPITPLCSPPPSYNPSSPLLSDFRETGRRKGWASEILVVSPPRRGTIYESIGPGNGDLE